MSEEKSTDPIEQRSWKLAQMRELGFDPYPHRYDSTHTIPEILGEFGEKDSAELEGLRSRVSAAGRIIALRGHGKAGFAHLQGDGAKLQVYVRQDRVGEQLYELFGLLDLGDMIGVEGEILRTRTQELTIFVDKLCILSKSLLPLPEKWHGLTDVELRYRQRYLDLIANPEVREVFIKRSKLVSSLRRFMEDHGFLEVETPMMQPMPGGATARPFKTFHEALDIPLYLRIAPELYLKRLTVGGLDRVYEINRNFRNEGISTQHNPEFTMMEFYWAYVDYHSLMEFTKAMLQRVVPEVTGALQVQFGEHQIDFARFGNFTMLEAIRHFWDKQQAPSAEQLSSMAWLRSELDSRSIPWRDGEGWGHLVGSLFEEVCEPHLIQPTFICDHPVELSPLSKRRDDDPRFVERFELYIAGFEVANGYSELNDPEEQRARFEDQAEARERGDLEAHEMDEDYIRALRYGLPPTGGEGIGIDRLAMVLTNSPSIRDVILFPQLRPEGGRSTAEERVSAPTPGEDLP